MSNTPIFMRTLLGSGLQATCLLQILRMHFDGMSLVSHDRRADRKFSDARTAAPPSYEEALGSPEYRASEEQRWFFSCIWVVRFLHNLFFHLGKACLFSVALIA